MGPDWVRASELLLRIIVDLALRRPSREGSSHRDYPKYPSPLPLSNLALTMAAASCLVT